MAAGVARLRRISAQIIVGAATEGSSPRLPELSKPVDTDALRKKYDEERDKRLAHREKLAAAGKGDVGNAQYKRLIDLAKTDVRYAKMLEDPWTEVKPRPPVRDEVEVCVVGTGYGGLVAGARLNMAGVPPSQIRLVDAAGDVGGTWYWNRYPGAMCDVESYTYMPLCEELGYTPTEKYAHQPEMWKHSRMIADRYGLFERMLLSAQVTGMEWQEDKAMWKVSTSKQDVFHARFVIMNFGTLVQPKVPGIPGLEDFKGHMFHTSRWDYAYTGGSTDGGLTKLHDKRVAIVGTGATAVQATPHLAEWAKQLFVFQRTPSSVDMRNQKKTTPEFAKESLGYPGWQKARQDSFTTMTQSADPDAVDLIDDGWTDIMRNLQQKFLQQRKAAKKSGAGDAKAAATEINKLMEQADFEQMERVRTRAETIVKDTQTAEALKPWYRQFCKRPCFHDDYLLSFNKDTVKLVHTDGKGIDALTPEGIKFEGVVYEVDCIVWATGFETGYNASGLGPEKIGYDPVGIGGQKLSERWKDGPRTFNSFNTAGFPNLWMQNAPQGAFTTNFVQQLDEVAKHAAHMIAKMRERNLRTLDASVDAENKYCEMIYNASGPGQKFMRTCTPGYYNAEGQIQVEKTLQAPAPGGPLPFFKRLTSMRESGTEFDGLVTSA